MAVSPTGDLSTPVSLLRSMVAASSTFQTWTGAADAAAALAYVHVITPSTFTPPFAVVSWAENFAHRLSSGGARNWFLPKGDLLLMFRGAVDVEHDEADAAYTFLNNVGAVLAEMLALTSSGYLPITEVTTEMCPGRPREDEKATNGDFYEALYRVAFGAQTG